MDHDHIDRLPTTIARTMVILPGVQIAWMWTNLDTRIGLIALTRLHLILREIVGAPYHLLRVEVLLSMMTPDDTAMPHLQVTMLLPLRQHMVVSHSDGKMILTIRVVQVTGIHPLKETGMNVNPPEGHGMLAQIVTLEVTPEGHPELPLSMIDIPPIVNLTVPLALLLTLLCHPTLARVPAVLVPFAVEVPQ